MCSYKVICLKLHFDPNTACKKKNKKERGMSNINCRIFLANFICSFICLLKNEFSNFYLKYIYLSSHCSTEFTFKTKYTWLSLHYAIALQILHLCWTCICYLIFHCTSIFPHISQAGKGFAVLINKTIRSIQSKHVVTAERDQITISSSPSS